MEAKDGPSLNAKRPLIFERVLLLAGGVYLTGGGIATLTAGRSTHANYLHASTSAAAAVIVGSLLLTLGTLGWRWFSSHL
jgi:hypothetical protein